MRDAVLPASKGAVSHSWGSFSQLGSRLDSDSYRFLIVTSII